ncbi:hypothetical protein Droror1_Dr00011512 [Drosera rotundifolia]
MPLNQSLPLECLRHNIHVKMSLPVRPPPHASMPGMLIRNVLDHQFHRLQFPLQLLPDPLTPTPPTIGGLKSLNYLNLSDNAFGGAIPRSLSNMMNLTIISLRGNYFSDNVPMGFDPAQVIDLSSNLFNGSFPSTLGGSSTTYMNLSYNNFSDELPSRFASNVLVNSTIDLSFNDLTGQIPNIKTLLSQNS